MTHPLHLTPEEAVKAVMWILMCSNDLLFVFICVALAFEFAVSSSSSITCKSEHDNEDGDDVQSDCCCIIMHSLTW